MTNCYFSYNDFMKNKIAIGIVLNAILVKFALAFCPVCTVAVGAGLGLARWLKIDDVISGLWIGALIVAFIGWTIGYLNKKHIKFFGRRPLIALFYYALFILPLYYYKIIGHPANTIIGIDKLIFGIVLGSILFTMAHYVHLYLKKKNNNKVYFPFQQVVIPITPIIIASAIFYFVLK